MSARPAPVHEGLEALLPKRDFADCFEIDVAKGRFDAVSAASCAFGTAPGWIKVLLGLRNVLVAPFGLTGEPPVQGAGRIGWFALISHSPERVVVGLDDRHLDFRIVVEHVAGDAVDTIRASTLIRRHNLGGQIYLALVLPFHRVIVPVMLASLGRA